MIAAILTSALAYLAKLGFSGAADRVITYLERKAGTQDGRERAKTEVTIEMIRAGIEETRIMADLQKTKMQVPVFWIFIGIFIVPLGAWWTAVIADSIFQFESWDVAELPPQIYPHAVKMINWLFYVGSTSGVVVGTVAALKRLR